MFCSHNNVFISHSSSNKEIVEQLSSYIEKLGVAPERIFCSSVVSQGIDNGEKLGKAISEAIGKSRVLVFLLSRDFVSSVYCMQELGVGWHLSEQGKAKCFCLVLPDISHLEIEGFVNSNVFKFAFIDETHKNDLSLFAENISKELHIQLPKHSVLLNYENVFFSAVADKIERLMLRKEELRREEKEKEERAELLEKILEEKDQRIEEQRNDIQLLHENKRFDLLKCEKRIMERTLLYFGFSSGVSQKQYKCNSKQFWFNNINHYCDVLEKMGVEPDNQDMEMMMATVYAAERIEDKAYEHIVNYVKLSCESDSSIYPVYLKNVFEGYTGSAKELIDIITEQLAIENEGITKDSYAETLRFLTEREEKIAEDKRQDD